VNFLDMEVTTLKPHNSVSRGASRRELGLFLQFSNYVVFDGITNHESPIRRANACLYRACRDAQGGPLTFLSDIVRASAERRR
jgi:hypothetical protein